MHKRKVERRGVAVEKQKLREKQRRREEKKMVYFQRNTDTISNPQQKVGNQTQAVHSDTGNEKDEESDDHTSKSEDNEENIEKVQPLNESINIRTSNKILKFEDFHPISNRTN
jgi:hypothetical protein